jgi:hypothetical protein
MYSPENQSTPDDDFQQTTRRYILEDRILRTMKILYDYFNLIHVHKNCNFHVYFLSFALSLLQDTQIFYEIYSKLLPLCTVATAACEMDRS